MVKKLNSSKHSKLRYLIGVVVVVLIIGAVYAYRHNNKIKPIPTVNQYTKGQVNQPGSPSNSSNQSVDSSPNASKTGGASVSLVAPTGNFVSDHHPNLSDNSM